MRKYHARFLEGWATARSPGYSAAWSSHFDDMPTSRSCELVPDCRSYKLWLNLDERQSDNGTRTIWPEFPLFRLSLLSDGRGWTQ